MKRVAQKTPELACESVEAMVKFHKTLHCKISRCSWDKQKRGAKNALIGMRKRRNYA